MAERAGAAKAKPAATAAAAAAAAAAAGPAAKRAPGPKTAGTTLPPSSDLKRTKKTRQPSVSAWLRSLGADNDQVFRQGNTQQLGLSVRCIKD